jgi:lipopolysaccharide export system permease protein
MALMKATAQDIIRRNLVGDFKPGKFQEEVSGFTFYAESVDKDGAWRNVLLFDGRDGKSPLLAVAPACHIESDPMTDWIGFSLEDGVLHRSRAETAEYTAMQFGQAKFRADIGEAMFRKNSFKLGPDEYAPLELLAEAEKAKARGQPGAPFLAAFHWRVAQVFLPLAFALLATPLALVRRSGARGRSWVQALGLYVAFFVTARILVQLGEKEQLAPWLAGYLPLVVCVVAGGLLLWRAERRGLA